MQQYTTLRPQSERGLGHLATWSPVCGVGLGSRLLLNPPYLHNELRKWGPPSFQMMQDRHHPDWPRTLPLLVHMWFSWESPLFLWWCFREHEEDSCPFLSVGCTLVAVVLTEGEQLPSLITRACTRRGAGYCAFLGNFLFPTLNLCTPWPSLPGSGIQSESIQGGRAASDTHLHLGFPTAQILDLLFKRHMDI